MESGGSLSFTGALSVGNSGNGQAGKCSLFLGQWVFFNDYRSGSITVEELYFNSFLAECLRLCVGVGFFGGL